MKLSKAVSLVVLTLLFSFSAFADGLGNHFQNLKTVLNHKEVSAILSSEVRAQGVRFIATLKSNLNNTANHVFQISYYNGRLQKNCSRNVYVKEFQLVKGGLVTRSVTSISAEICK